MPKNKYMKFDIAIRDYYGCTNTAVAFSRLLYWFGKKPGGFYKFKQACKKHPLYKKGDSWGEELGMSRKVIDPIFSRLVNHHSTKSDFLKQEDKFKGKMFASYTNHKTNQTYYFIDREGVDSFLSKLSIRKQAQPPLPSLSDVPQPVDNLAKESEIVPFNQPSDVPNVPPLARTHPDLSVFQTSTSLLGSAPRDSLEVEREKEKLSSKKMVELWNSYTQDKVIWYPSTAAKLYKILVDFFNGCLESFKKYCSAIGNTPFLIGKAPNSNFKAFFYWAIQPEIIKSIFQGAYGVKDILSQIGNVSEQSKLQYEINTITYEILNLEKKIEHSKQSVIDSQKKLISEHQKTISQEVKDEILKSVQEEIDEKFPLVESSKWEDVAIMRDLLRNVQSLTNVQYDAALVNYSHIKLNLCKAEDIIPPELFAAKQSLEEKRAALCKRLEHVIIENSKAQKVIKTLVERAA